MLSISEELNLLSPKDSIFKLVGNTNVLNSVKRLLDKFILLTVFDIAMSNIVSKFLQKFICTNDVNLSIPDISYNLDEVH